MNYLKRLGPLAIAVAALMVFAASAPATTLTSPAGTTYTGTLKAESVNFRVDEPFSELPCAQSQFELKVEQHGAALTAAGQLSSLTFSNCTYPMTVKKPGKFEIHSNGVVTWSGAEIIHHTWAGACVFTPTNTALGTLTSGSPATLHVNAAIPRTAGSPTCGSYKYWTGSYTVVTPSTLVVD